jgi:Tol biopolymer transport system component
MAKWVDGEWTDPVVVPFSGDGYDKEPYVSPDGLKLFFASTRPTWSDESDSKGHSREGVNPSKQQAASSKQNGISSEPDFNLWVTYRNADGTWGEPHSLTTVNSPAYDNYPAVAANGNLYFSSKRDSERNDLWVARFEDGAFIEPESIAELNTDWSDADPYIDPEERFMIYSSTRPGGFGSGDLYLTYNKSGTWSEPVNLGPLVNTDDYEYTPMLSPDGETLYFSRGWGEIYSMKWNHVVDRR